MLSPRCLVLFLAFVLASRAVAEERPVLVVVVSVDQLCYEYLERFHRNFSDEGLFRHVEKNGVWFTDCHHRHAFTYTAPGHAVQLTGCYASEHGIVGNDWFDRATGKKVYCVSDKTVKLIGTTISDPLVSPRNLFADTLGDRLKIATGGKAKVFGVAIKDRASILMTGHLADAAYWMSNDGKWITCDYYRNDLPGYLRNINESGAVSRYADKSWDLLLKPERYLHGMTEDSFCEKPYAGAKPDFPHVIVAATDKNYVKQVSGGPFGNEFALEAAATVFKHESLGQDDVPDLLCINLSSNDYVGHAFGPQSLEVEDMTYRTDEQLGAFVRYLGEEMGDRPWIFALTADHAVSPVPEVMQRAGLTAARDPFGKADDKGNYPTISGPLEALLKKTFVKDDAATPLVQAVTDNEVFLYPDHPALAGDKFLEAQRIVRDYLLAHPAIAAAVTREQMLSGKQSTKLEQMFRRSFHPKRSGDVLFALRPYHIHGQTAATTHGSPWEYDTHVPLLLLGNNVSALRKGKVTQNVSPAQLCPTLAKLLKVTPPAMCMEPAIDDVLKP